MDLDYSMMFNLMEVELNLKELEEGHKQKYFSKNTKRKWSFNCHHCEEKVASNEADSILLCQLHGNTLVLIVAASVRETVRISIAENNKLNC